MPQAKAPAPAAEVAPAAAGDTAESAPPVDAGLSVLAGAAAAPDGSTVERDAAAVFALSAAEHRNATGRHRAQLTQLSSFAGGDDLADPRRRAARRRAHGVVMRTRAPLLRWLVLAVLLAGRGSEAFAPGAGLAAPFASRAPSPSMMPLGTPKVAYRPPGANSGDWIDIYNRLYRERIMFMGQPIMEDPVNQIIAVMLFLDSEEVKPMYMYINSPGGSVTAGFALYDTMNLISADVATVNVGLAASMVPSLCSNYRCDPDAS